MASPDQNERTFRQAKVFASDVTIDASINPIAYEEGESVFIDTKYDTRNMDSVALEKEFEIYLKVKVLFWHISMVLSVG